MENEDEIFKGAVNLDAGSGGKVDLSGVAKTGVPTNPTTGKPLSRKNKEHPEYKPRGPYGAKSASPSAPVSDADAAFIAESCVLLLESGDELIAKTLARKLAKVAPEKAQDFIDLQKDVGLNEKDKGMLRASVSAIVKKYAILGRFGPEILLLVFLTQYSIRQIKLAHFVNEIVAERKGKTNGVKQVQATRFPEPSNAQS